MSPDVALPSSFPDGEYFVTLRWPGFVTQRLQYWRGGLHANPTTLSRRR